MRVLGGVASVAVAALILWREFHHMTNSSGVRSVFASLIAAIVLSAVIVAPAAAIRNGALDGNDHPYVGLVTFHQANGNYLWRCTGTLLSLTVFLTAGHCTESPAVSAHVWFVPGPVIPDAAYNAVTKSCAGISGYPCGGYASAGTPYTHPDYDPDAFWLADLGIIVLSTPVSMANYGLLPTPNQLDALKPRLGTTFTAVGYGLQRAFGFGATGKNLAIIERMVAHPRLLQINNGSVGDYSILLSNNITTGGTCTGDSGGPNFIGVSRVIAGTTSYGKNPTCAGTGGVYRVDRADDLDWIATFF